ncbi:SGNH/GDSL hydrolase family protein [Massilia endophytica]|uniref:SGNH/GDSL hydrolase family protein n=1 Tax=Massilia endophytica TaxID=2899220 RepID=UPI001E41FFBF|nr:SGNH/GDSL hydrolase family protein [Massilia endophytica]UGQ47117.1 SGNH/GDSL hydrolase family protein [Massilia endophytica]
MIQRSTAWLLAAMLASLPVAAAEPTWTTSWYAAPQPSWGPAFALPTNVPPVLAAQTVRETLRTSAGGGSLRVMLSNRYGKAPLVIGEARVARTREAQAATQGAGAGLRFGGQPGVTIPPGGSALSDPVDFRTEALERLSVSLWLPGRAALDSFHWGAQQTAWLAQGNQSAAELMSAAQPMHGRSFVSALHVSGPAGATLVAFGDSITDGNGSTPDANRRWPDYLAERLAPHGIAVANAGISGARLLADGMGVKAAERFRHDVLEQPGVKAVVILMGINDIGWPRSAFAPQDAPMTAERMIGAYRQLIAMAHEHNVKVIGATLLPYEGSLHGTPFSGHYTPEKDAVRREVNEWIRSSGAFDAVADLDAVTRDPSHPSRLLARYDSGDHLHPGDEGYRAIAESFSLEQLRAMVAP